MRNVTTPQAAPSNRHIVPLVFASVHAAKAALAQQRPKLQAGYGRLRLRVLPQALHARAHASAASRARSDCRTSMGRLSAARLPICARRPQKAVKSLHRRVAQNANRVSHSAGSPGTAQLALPAN